MRRCFICVFQQQTHWGDQNTDWLMKAQFMPFDMHAESIDLQKRQTTKVETVVSHILKVEYQQHQ